MEKNRKVDDICFKFIVDDVDYTSIDKKLSTFSFDYRMNKMYKDRKYKFMGSYELYKDINLIKSVSYYASEDDYKKCHRSGTCAYEKLCTVVSSIYADF